MISPEYRALIKIIVKNSIRKRFPGLKSKEIEEVSVTISRAIHARFYGANVDGVDSPIWQDTDRMNDTRTKPNIDAKDLLEQL